MKKKWLLISLGIAALDQAIKAAVRARPLGETLFELAGVVRITHSLNTGAAFSMLWGHTALLAALSVFLLAALSVVVFRYMHLTCAAQAAFCVLIGGGVGNLIDRIAFSGVTDYIKLLIFDFPVFNLADIAITGAVCMLMVLLLTGRFEKTTGEKHGSDY